MGPIFNEKVEFVGSMNNTFMHCLQKTGQQLRLKKKKKKRENADAARLSAIQRYTKGVFGLSLFLLKLKTL